MLVGGTVMRALYARSAIYLDGGSGVVETGNAKNAWNMNKGTTKCFCSMTSLGHMLPHVGRTYTTRNIPKTLLLLTTT